MERDIHEAEIAKEIAEKKFVENDLMGAEEFACKAQDLYPELDGLAEMIAALEVHIAAENKINGYLDWYGILDVDQFADEDIVRKQYKKLVLLLHPDKNKFVGADDAFKLLIEAWSVLSDEEKRLSYDEKTNEFRQWPWKPEEPASPMGSSDHDNASSVNNDGGFYSLNDSKDPPPPLYFPAWLIPQKPTTFWANCPFCKAQHEHHRMYENCNLTCPNCKKIFYAEVTTVDNMMSPEPPSEFQFPHPSLRSGREQQTSRKEKDRFWTSCPFCKSQYEFHRMSENQNLKCSNCKKFFCAVETTRSTMNALTSGFQWSSNF